MSGKEPAVGPEEVVVRKRGRPKKIRNADEGDIQGKRQKIDINLSAVADAGADGLGTYGYGVLETKQLLNETPLGFPAAAFHNESRISQVVSNNATSSGIATGNVVPHGVEGESNVTMGANHLSDELMRVGAWNLILRVHGSSTPAPGGAADFPGETGEMGERGLTLCICCRQPEIKRQTIICDSCEQSFHIGCVRLPYTNANDLDDWNCASCAPSTIANGDVGIVDQQYQDRKQGRLGVQKSAHRGRPRKIVVPRPQRTLDLNKPADASEEFQQMQGQNGFTEENTRFEDSKVSNSGTQLQQMQFENKGADVSSVPVKEIVARDANADNTLNAKQLVTGFTGMELMNANSELSGSKRFIDAVDTTRGYQSNGRDTAAFGTDEKRFATAGDVGNPIDLTLAESPEKLVFPSKDLSRLAGKSSGLMDATGSVEGIGRVNLSASFNPPGEPPLVHDSNQINLPRVLVDDTKQTNLPSAFFARKENNSLTLEPNSSVIDFGCMTKEVTNVSGEHTTDEVGEVTGNDARKSYHPLTPFRMGMGEESSGPVKVSNFKSDSGHEVQEVGISHSASSLGRLPEQALAFEGGIVNSKFSSTIQGLGPGHGSRVDTSGVSAIQRTGSQVLNSEEVGGTAYGKQDGEDLRANAEGLLQQPEDQQLKVVADETLRLLKDFISERHRASLPDGWMVDVKRRRNDRHLDKYFISPDKQRFRSRPEVLRHLGLADELRGKLESQGLYRDSASPTQHLASEVEKVQVPFKCGDLTIETLGVVDMEASLTNNGSQLCPVGYRSSWHDAVTASHYVSEVINGGNQTLAFRVTREFCPTSRLSCSETAGSFGSGAAEGANAVGKRIEGQIGGLQKQEANAPIFEDSVRALLGDLAGPADEEDIQDSGPTFRDEVGEITVEASSTVQAWRMLGYEFVNRCRKSPWVLDSLPHICPHVKLNVVSSDHQAMDTSGVNVDRSIESRLSALLERLEKDHFGLQEGFVQEMIRLHVNWIRSVEVENSTGSRSFQDRGLTSRPDGLVLKPNSQLRFRAREKARRQKRAPEGLSEEPKEPVAVEPSDHSGKDETVTQPPPIERPSPPAGRPLAKRIPADLVGDVLQIWEFLTRFAPIIRDPHPPLLEDLEEGLSCGASITSEILGGSVVLQPNLKEDRGNNSSAEPNMSAASTGMDLVVVGSESSRDGLSAQPNKPSTPSQMSLPQLSEGSFQNPKEGVAEVHQQDHHKQLTGESRLSASPVIVPKLEDSYADAVGCSPAKFIMSPGFALAGSIHIPLMKYLLSDLLSKLCGRDEVPGEAEESKPSKRGRKRVRDTVLRPILGREKLNDSFSMNEWTWPEIARRYIISISSLSKVGEISEVTTSECLKVLRCIQGDGGVLCGALDGVASMEVDAQLLAEAEKELAVGTHEHDDTDSPATPSANGKELEESKSLEPAGDTARWIKILDPISKLPTNVGSRIRNRVRDALEADPPEWASHLLEHSISKEVYKGNASGPTKRIVMEVISKYRGEDPKIRKTKKLRKRVVPSPEVVMQRCRIVLRQVAAEDKEHIVSKGIGEMITNFYESEGEGVLPRPLDFRAIDLRLGAGAYGTSPDAFAEDVRQIWKNISLIYGNDSDELKATNAFSELFESLFSKQVITFQRGVDSLTASAANGHTAGSAGEGAGHNTSGDGPSAPNVQENVKAPWEDDSCRICGIDDDHDNVLLCDGCDAEYHIYCLKPPLQEVPEGNWYCSSCEAVDKGFLEEPSVTEVAPESQTFEKQDDSVQQKITSTEDVLEKEHTQDAECPEDATSMALATKLEVTDYWRLSLADRVQFLKFLCDRALETLEIRIHMEEIMDVAGEMQQKLRQMLLERRRYTELGEGRVDNSRDAKNAFSVLQGSAAKARKQGVELGKEPVGNSSPHPNDLIDIPSSEDCLALSLPARDILTDVATLQASASEDTNMHSTSQEKHREQDLSNSDTIVVLNEEAINSDAAGLQDITENVGKPSQILGSGDTLTVTPAATHVIVGNSAAVNNDLKVSLSSTETGGHLLVRSTSSVDGDVTKIIHPRALQNSRDADIENAIAKLRSISIRRDSLGKDSCGREYWALFGCNAKPWVAVETLSSDRQYKTEDASATAASSSPTACHSTLNPENDADGGNDSVAGPVIGEHLQRKPENEHVWSIYSDGEALDKLIQWLSPTVLLERSLRTNLLQWRPWFWTGEISDTGRGEAPETLQAKQEGFVTPDRANNTSLASRGAGAWKTGSVSVTATLKATKILEWRYKGVCHSGSKETNSAVGSKRGRKKRSQAGTELSRCKCLEPVWSSRHHCATCHTTFESALDLEIHAKDTSCSPVKKNATEREPSKKSKKGGQTGKTSQSKKLSEVPVSAQSSALNGKLPEIAAMSFVVHETTRDRVNRIGLIADKGPSFAPGLSVSPAFDPSLMIFDSPVGHALSSTEGDANGNQLLLSTLAVGGTSCISHVDSEDSKSSSWVLVKSFEDLPGKADGASESSGILLSPEDRARLGTDKLDPHSTDHRRPENFSRGISQPTGANARGRLFQVTGKQLVISEASLISLADRDLRLLDQLKMNLFDIEAALESDMLQLGRAQTSRRQAWRSFVKKAKSIYTMVQAAIILEHMIRADFLRNSWGYWSSFSAAAKTATLSSLSLRVYALDAAILYENSRDYLGPESLACELKQTKKEKERKGTQASKSSGKKKRKDDASTS